MNEVIMRVTFEAEAEVTKAADIRQWTVRGVFDDDTATVEVGHNAVYIRTDDAVSDSAAYQLGARQRRVCMLTPSGARQLAAALDCAADNAETMKDHS